MKIEKGIPIGSQRANLQTKYPFKEMEIGDSFVVPKDELPKNGGCGLHNSARYVGVKIATRTQTDGSVRVWRVA